MGLKSRVEGKSILKSQEVKKRKRPAEKAGDTRTKKKTGAETTVSHFSELDLHDQLHQVLADLQVQEMTPLQAQCVPLLLQGKDVLATVDPGAGRRLTFLVSAVARLQQRALAPEDGTGVIILCPTRESALQTKTTAKEILKRMGISCCVVMDGTNQEREENRLAKHVQVLIATPQRLLNHLLSSRGFRYQKLACLIVDGADVMLRKGLDATLRQVLKLLPQERQTAVFMSAETQEVGAVFSLQNPERLTLTSPPAEARGWQQGYTVVDADKKFLLLYSFLRKNLGTKAVVFMSTSATVKYYSEMLPVLGIPVTGIHGMQKSAKRDAIFADFCSAHSGILLCTDLAARGLELPALQWAIQYDPPEDVTEYLTRVGRTPRADLQGTTLLFLLPCELAFLDRLQSTSGTPSQFNFSLNRLVDIQSHYEKILDKNYHLHVAARAAHRAFILAYAAHTDKDVYDVTRLDLMKVGKSFGFPVAPRVNFAKVAPKEIHETQDRDQDDSDEEKRPPQPYVIMLPPETRLMPLCLRYLQIHCLEETPFSYQFPVEDNPALLSQPKSDPGTIPITLKINNDLVHDNFYSVKAVFDKSLGIVQRGIIKVLVWSFDFRDGVLELKIAKAITMTNAVSGEQPLTPLEHNSQIRSALHKLRHKAILKLASDMPVVVSEDTESDITENSALGEKELEQLQPAPKPPAPTPQKLASFNSPKMVSPKLTSPKMTSPKLQMNSPSLQMTPRVPAASLEPEGYFARRQLNEPMIMGTPADIGRSAKAKEHAEDFSRSRRRRSPVSTPQDDLLSPYKMQKTPNPRSEPRPARLTPGAGGSEGLTIEKFPEFALEYLKYYYHL